LGYLSYGAKKDQTTKNGDKPEKHEEGEKQ